MDRAIRTSVDYAPRRFQDWCLDHGEKRTKRKLAAILAADVVGYSRLMGESETGTLTLLKSLRREVFYPKVSEYGGRVVNTTGDGILVEFPSAVDAVQQAVDVQREMAQRNCDMPENQRMDLRIGINLGDIIVDGDEIYGDGINIAARLEQLAEPGGICLSGAVHENVRNKLDVDIDNIGEREFKNIAKPVHVYAVVLNKRTPAIVAHSLSDKPSIAVLPFVNISGDPEQEFLCDGITDDIITALSRLRWFLVIASNSSFIYKGSAVDLRQISQELGVRYVLEGSIRKAGNKVRINAQLIDAATRNHIWANKYDRELDDIFAMQDEITQSVTAAIEPKLVAAEGLRVKDRPPHDLDAWGLVTRAMALYWHMTTADSDAAIEMLRLAVKRYPDYGPAQSMLAFTLLVSGHVGWTPDTDDFAYAKNLARRAATLDDEDPWVHLALGYCEFTNRHTDDAVFEYNRALDLNPNFATAYGYLGWALAFDGQSDVAIEKFQQALRMSPYDPLRAFFYSGTGVAHYCARNYIETVKWSREAIQLRPGFTAARRIFCASLAQVGRFEEAAEELVKLRQVQPDISISWCEKYVPYTSQTMPHFIEGMRLAGLE